MTVRDWLAEQSATVRKLKVPLQTEASLLAMLHVVCWLVSNERDWHDEEPAIVGFTERGQNALAVADERVRAMERAKTTLPPPVILSKVDKSGHIVQLTIEHEGRSAVFTVGGGTVHYVRTCESIKGLIECRGETCADSSAIREIFRWVATGHGQWVAG